MDYKLIGEGAYGTVLRKTTATKDLAIKIGMDAYKERKKHFLLWRKLPPHCKKYFPEPLPIPRQVRRNFANKPIHAMEYIHGKTMFQFVHTQLEKGNIQAIRKSFQLLKRAIMCLWMNGFIHNDLHMENIIVYRNSIKIIDFDFLKRVTPLNTYATYSQVVNWYSKHYENTLSECGLKKINPNLTAFGIKKYKMFNKKSNILYRFLHNVFKK